MRPLRWARLAHSTAMPLARPVAVLAALAIVLVACDGGDDAGEDATSAVEVAPVTVPPERLTPFCQGMIDLADTLETDPPDDVEAYIIERYTALLPDVPAEIEDDFRSVLALLQADANIDANIDENLGGTGADDGGPAAGSDSTVTAPDASGTTTPDEPTGTADPLEDFDAEGRLPDGDPAQRVNDYVDFTCRDSVNNPGPAATEPLDAPDEG